MAHPRDFHDPAFGSTSLQPSSTSREVSDPLLSGTYSSSFGQYQAPYHSAAAATTKSSNSYSSRRGDSYAQQGTSAKMASPILYAAIVLLMIDSIIELAFITSMVSWIHRVASGNFPVNDGGHTFTLHGKPLNFLLDQGHTSNGAAGTAFIVVGIGGFIALWLRDRPAYYNSLLSKAFYRTWLTISVLGFLLTTAALAYVFAVTNAHRGQSIDVSVAAKIVDNAHYPLDTWTPQNWFPAVLKLDLADPHNRSDIAQHLKIMRGWQYNLIPMFLIQLGTTALIVMNALQVRKKKAVNPHYNSVEQKTSSSI